MDDELADELRAVDVHPGDGNLKHYWLHGEGAAKWKTWTQLYHHLIKFVSPGKAKRIAAEWFHERYGFWPGDHKNRAVGDSEYAHLLREADAFLMESVNDDHEIVDVTEPIYGSVATSMDPWIRSRAQAILTTGLPALPDLEENDQYGEQEQCVERDDDGTNRGVLG